MRNMPSLLNYNSSCALPRELFTDLQLDKLLNPQAISVLQKICGEEEILRREELFSFLENDDVLYQIKGCLTALLSSERMLILLKGAKTQFDRYHRHKEVFEAYICACETLSSLSNIGSLMHDVAKYFSSDEKESILSEMKEATQKITSLLDRMHVGLLSFADKNWITPDCAAVSEFDYVAKCAEKLGFYVPEKKKKVTKIDLALSDAICRLYVDEVLEIEALIAKFANVDLYEPIAYISEIKFFLEIRELIMKAEMIGVPHSYPKIADRPQYAAKELYDVSLLAKNCDNIVPNDANFIEDERGYFLVGANGGGKTTYLRAVGINLILFLSGCPVFAKDAEIYPFGSVFSHFPKDERFDDVGRLDEELKRTNAILRNSENKTAFLLFNETYSGTDEKRGFDLLKTTVDRIRASKHFCLYVTHFHEVMALEYPVLSAEIDPNDENKRTYRIVKTKGNASSYAADILKKYRLDKESLAARRSGDGN